MKAYDVVVFGATGFTGALVAEHLAKKYGKSGDELNWAIAGRSEKKLQKTLEKLAKYVGDWCLEKGAIPLIIADSGDMDSLDRMCAQTKVVVSTVGPFMKYGTLLVEACINNGTDYCDSTGETTWIKRMLDTYGKDAIKQGVRVVPSCGYDSLPSDIGAMVLIDFIKKQDPTTKIKQVTHFVGPMKGEASGGTLSTMFTIMGSEEKSQLAKVYGNPYSLTGKGFKGKDTGELRWFQFSDIIKNYTAPWFMAGTNERLVRRTAYLQSKLNEEGHELDYGKSFQYREVLVVSSFIQGFLISLAMTVGFGLLFAIPPLRWAIEKYILPPPGTGPSRKTMETGYAYSYMHTVADGQSYICDVSIADGDCGYRSTGMMLAECAVALSKTQDSVPENRAGFQTPASCYGLGLDILEPLASCAITFTPRAVETKSVSNIVLPFGSKRPKQLRNKL